MIIDDITHLKDYIRLLPTLKTLSAFWTAMTCKLCRKDALNGMPTDVL